MIIITDPDRSFRNHVTKGATGFGDCQGFESTAELEHALAMAPNGTAAVVIFGPGVALDDALETATWLQGRSSPVSTLLVTTGFSAEVLHAAMRAGMTDVLADSFTPEQLHEAVQRSLGMASRLVGSPAAIGSSTKSKIVTVFSTKGGSGKSVIASNLAMLLAESTGERVALVDLDLQSGDLAIMLQMLPAWTIYDAAENLGRLDGDALEGYLTPHRSGVSLLAAPLEPALAETVSAQAVQTILYLLAERFAYVIVDGPALFTDQVIAALDISHETILTASLDVPSVKNLKLALQTFTKLGIGRERIHLVLNRADSKVGLRLQEVEKSLGTQIDVAIPSSRDVPLSINQGAPLALESKRSAVVASIQKLADRVQIDTQPTKADRARRSLLGRN